MRPTAPPTPATVAPPVTSDFSGVVRRAVAGDAPLVGGDGLAVLELERLAGRSRPRCRSPARKDSTRSRPRGDALLDHGGQLGGVSARLGHRYTVRPMRPRSLFAIVLASATGPVGVQPGRAIRRRSPPTRPSARRRRGVGRASRRSRTARSTVRVDCGATARPEPLLRPAGHVEELRRRRLRDHRGASRLRRSAGSDGRAGGQSGGGDRRARSAPCSSIRAARAAAPSTTPRRPARSSAREVLRALRRGRRRSARRRAAAIPIDCLTDAQIDELIAVDGTPGLAGRGAGRSSRSRRCRAEGCAAKAGDVWAHMGTVDAARDMDIARAVVKDETFNYLGKSYGTMLGRHVRRAVPRSRRAHGARRRAAGRASTSSR